MRSGVRYSGRNIADHSTGRDVSREKTKTRPVAGGMGSRQVITRPAQEKSSVTTTQQASMKSFRGGYGRRLFASR